ncbi:uncharacterized protein TRUGW13939_07935 [Talaromyces rugulosus]|uniref:Uncharacterized protein n=1 Tax=Talaromyces rugulosus TaxID=121627 RepID=A0A7H8R326_TALRU|nr:uncharacterized protein TRUGW13939_07935 [Talaromyces rugulosus]QKX60789.1 hypothetical protein TRUGW13939_07935 [Talaromyces rugulosus]
MLTNTPKHLARQYYQFKTGHTPIRAYLHRIKAQDFPNCLGYSKRTETVRHLLTNYRQWCHQQKKLYAGLAEAEIKALQNSEQCPEARLFQDPKATTALLAFIGAIREQEDNQQT